MCAECHSTAVKKNYDVVSGGFATTFEAPNVSCEACHGPARRTPSRRGASDTRVDCAREADGELRALPLAEYAVHRRVRARPAAGGHASSSRCSTRSCTIPTDRSAARCTSYGSFAQSSMYAHGVTCSDCHDPHSATLKRTDGARVTTASAVCASCHATEKYQTSKHHFHTAGSPGSDCVGCHMPPTTSMVVGRATRPQHARSATGPLGVARRPERVHQVPHDAQRELGRAPG